MSKKMIENNKACVIGEIASGFTFSHEVFGEGFYLVDVTVSHLSDQADVIPLMISERLININENYKGCTIGARGQFRFYNRHKEARDHLMPSIFVQEITFMEEFTDYTKINQIFLDSYICKMPIYRKMPSGHKIVDLLVAVNRPHGKSDYVPRIARGGNARYAFDFEVDARVKLWGRIQSREHIKKISGNECEKRVAYEVSVGELKSGEMEMREEMQPSTLSGT